ncbi:peptidase M50 [Marmoricola endophyticus]|uniref:Zinc metalloprotease n=1 Tax=Marmoricola endophyticus TaxID=2040280 RepID=A0A917F124_9ACTN|nr:site-2 protease family protein [Marmoricola endophyticus]GGF34262.1 peptidase M50 [Marmoricola endophyticus]
MDQGRRPLPPGTWRIGSIAGVDVLLRSSWLLVAALIAVVLAPRVDQVAPGLGALRYVAGVAFAVLLYASVLLHEASHAVAARRFGLPVRSITLHFLGGVTELGGEARTPRAELVIAVVGPLTSLLVGAAALLSLTVVGPDAGLLRMALEALAVANLAVGVLNLVPGLPLDGGRVLRALVWGAGASPHRATTVAAWGGRVAAVLVLGWPLLLEVGLGRRASVIDYLMAVVIAVFLWGGANASLLQARLRRRLAGITARDLARRAALVPATLSVAQSVGRAEEEQAGGIVVVADPVPPSGSAPHVVAIVTEAALEAIPLERRPWLAVSQVSRTMEDGLRLSSDLDGEELLDAMSAHPASEYLLVDADGAVYGLLAARDVERALSTSAVR